MPSSVRLPQNHVFSLLSENVLCYGIHLGPGPVLPMNGDMKPVWPGVHLPPLVKAFPDITSLGLMPKKPPRPPHVDLSAYRTHQLENTTENASMSKLFI